jgi:hypothetical protein
VIHFIFLHITTKCLTEELGKILNIPLSYTPTDRNYIMGIVIAATPIFNEDGGKNKIYKMANVKTIDKMTQDNYGTLQNYGEKLHFARYPNDKVQLIQNPNAKINDPVTIHFDPTEFVKQYRLDTGSVGSAHSICVSDSEGLHASLEKCLKDIHALETKYKNKYNYKYLKYKIKYLNLKLLNK